MNRTSRLLIAAALAIAVTACGGSSDTDTDSAADVAVSASPKAAASPAVKCEAVAQAMLDAIAEGAEKDVGKLTLADGAAYRSPDFQKLYFVAAKMTVPGVNGEVAVWATNSITPGGGLIMAVDGVAQQFTVWPDADKTKADISKADPAVAKAKGCVDA